MGRLDSLFVGLYPLLLRTRKLPRMRKRLPRPRPFRQVFAGTHSQNSPVHTLLGGVFFFISSPTVTCKKSGDDRCENNNPQN